MNPQNSDTTIDSSNHFVSQTNLALSHQLRLAVAASILSMLFRLLILVFVPSSMGDIVKIWFGIPLNLAILAFDFFAFYAFKKLLNESFNFGQADKTIYAYLVYLVFFSIISISLLFSDLTILASIIQIVGYGLLYALATRLQLLQKPFDLYGLQKSYVGSLKALSVVKLLGLGWLVIEAIFIPETSEIPIILVILLTLLSLAKFLLFLINTFFFIKILVDGTKKAPKALEVREIITK